MTFYYKQTKKSIFAIFLLYCTIAKVYIYTHGGGGMQFSAIPRRNIETECESKSKNWDRIKKTCDFRLKRGRIKKMWDTVKNRVDDITSSQ